MNSLLLTKNESSGVVVPPYGHFSIVLALMTFIKSELKDTVRLSVTSVTSGPIYGENRRTTSV